MSFNTRISELKNAEKFLALPEKGKEEIKFLYQIQEKLKKEKKESLWKLFEGANCTPNIYRHFNYAKHIHSDEYKSVFIDHREYRVKEFDFSEVDVEMVCHFIFHYQGKKWPLTAPLSKRNVDINHFGGWLIGHSVIKPEEANPRFGLGIVFYGLGTQILGEYTGIFLEDYQVSRTNTHLYLTKEGEVEDAPVKVIVIEMP